MSPRTLRVIRARCQGGSSCHVPVDSTIFGDPCPGTYKYVEVHYSCERGERVGSAVKLIFSRTIYRILYQPDRPYLTYK